VSYSERYGNLFEAEDLDAIGHGVNCRGVMGAGIAREFALRWPTLKRGYVTMVEDELLYPGDCWAWNQTPSYKMIYNLASQERPGPDAKLRWVAQSVAKMLQHAEDNGIQRIGLPQIGCGIGGLEWVEVRMILELLANESSVELIVFSL